MESNKKSNGINSKEKTQKLEKAHLELKKKNDARNNLF